MVSGGIRVENWQKGARKLVFLLLAEVNYSMLISVMNGLHHGIGKKGARKLVFLLLAEINSQEGRHMSEERLSLENIDKI